MLSEPHPPARRPLLIEGIVLLGATPFLMFPTLAPPLAWLSAGVLAAIWLWQRVFHQEPLVPPSAFSLALALWGATLVMGSLVSADPDLTLPKAAGLFLGFAVWRFLARAIHTPRQFNQGLLLLGGLGAALIVVGFFSADWAFEVGFVQRLFGRLPPHLFSLPESPTGGVHTNQLAGTIVVYLPLALTACLVRPPTRRRFLSWVGWLVGLLGLLGLIALLFLTQSRSAWLAALGSLGALVLFWAVALPPTSSARRRLWLLLGLCLVAIIGAAVAVGPGRWQQLWQEPPRTSAIGTLSTLEFRREVWRWAVTGIHDFPFTGLGLGAFRRAVHRLYPIAIEETYDIAHAHNIFLQVALDTGLPGVIAYLALLGAAVGLTIWCARHFPARRAWAIGLGVAVITFHLYGLIDALAPGSKTGVILWVLWGLIAALPQTVAPGALAQALVGGVGDSAD